MSHITGKLKENFNFWEGNANILLTYIKQVSTVNANKCWSSNTKNVIWITPHYKVHRINVKID